MNKILEDFRCTKEAIQHNFNKIFEYMKTTSTFSNKTKKLNKAFSRLIQEVNYEYLQSAILFAKRNIVHPSIITPNHHLKKVLSSQINIGGDSLWSTSKSSTQIINYFLFSFYDIDFSVLSLFLKRLEFFFPFLNKIKIIFLKD